EERQEMVTCCPTPAAPATKDMTIGKLDLTDHEEDQIVTFLMTLTDGYTTPYPNGDTYAGACMTGGSAKTQGNESLIPTPPLPACSPEVCGLSPLPLSPVP